jgi:AcrR family transcriptional regulator
MTAKQKRILHTAASLFAREGFAGTSTARIAREAEVSEGLIFRHFKNKQGLLDAIAVQAASDGELHVTALREENDMLARIHLAISQAFAKTGTDKPFVALQVQMMDAGSGFGESSYKNLDEVLAEAFRSLNYEDPLTEARFLRCALQGIRNALATGSLPAAKKLRDFLLAMYA